MPTPKAFGQSFEQYQTLAPALAKLGATPQIIRTYASLDGWQGQDPASVVAAGYAVAASIKPKGDKDPMVAADVVAGKHDAKLIALMDQLLALPRVAHRHVFVGWHEPDTYQPKGGKGTQADVDAAVAHIIALFVSRPTFNASTWDVSLTLTGYQFVQRIGGYPKSLAAVQALGSRGIVGLDQPYTPDFEKEIGPACDYIAAHWPRQRVQIHECGRDAAVLSDGQTRTRWLADFARALMTSRYDQVDAVIYWNNGNVNVDPAKTDDVAALALFAKTIGISVDQAKINALQAQVDQLTAANATLTADNATLTARVANAKLALG